MDIRVLRYFLMVAREENITNAARALHITQPTLSRQMKSLEEELHTSLFIRKNHSITLTPEGMMLRRRAQELVSLLDKTQQEFTQQAKDLAGEITIGCGEFQADCVLAEIFCKFHKIHDQVRIHIVSSNFDEVCLQIDQGLLDFGLLMDPIDITKYSYARLPILEQWGIFMPKAHPLAQKERIHPQDLIGENILMPPRSAVHSLLGNWLQDETQFSIIGGSTLQYNMMMLAKAGLGVAFGLKLEAQYTNLVFRPLEPAIEQRTSLIWKKSQPQSPLTRAFLDFVQKSLSRNAF